MIPSTQVQTFWTHSVCFTYFRDSWKKTCDYGNVLGLFEVWPQFTDNGISRQSIFQQTETIPWLKVHQNYLVPCSWWIQPQPGFSEVTLRSVNSLRLQKPKNGTKCPTSRCFCPDVTVILLRHSSNLHSEYALTTSGLVEFCSSLLKSFSRRVFSFQNDSERCNVAWDFGPVFLSKWVSGVESDYTKGISVVVRLPLATTAHNCLPFLLSCLRISPPWDEAAFF